MNEKDLRDVIEQVVSRVMNGFAAPSGSAAPAAQRGAAGQDFAGIASAASDAASASLAALVPTAGDGVFERMDEAIDAGEAAFRQYQRANMESRAAILEGLRQCARVYREPLAREELAETHVGRVDHKTLKFDLIVERTPGVEFLTTYCKTGDHGLTIEEYAPYGLIGAVTPVTHAVPTLLNNSLSFLAGGNTAVFNAHPSSKNIFAKGVALFNRAMKAAGAPCNLLATIKEPTIESADLMFRHPKVRLLLVTGGPGVVKAALQTPKRAITAGPGNPPVVVDETADIPRAARSIIAGAGFDNNIVCIGEKEIFAVDSIADALKREMIAQGCVELNASQMDALARAAFQKKDGAAHAMVNRDLVGRDACVLARVIGLEVPKTTPLLIGETSRDNPWVVEEQMMPCIPLVRCRDVHQAIDWAIEAEHGFRHTAIMHSKNIENMSLMAQRCDCSIFVKNGPSLAGLGADGEGYTSFSIASPTGEGLTNCRTFCRFRRCTLVDYFRII